MRAGFMGVEQLWTPWCVALDGDEIASFSFTASLSPASAEVGVETVEPYGGGGLAAAVTAGWVARPVLSGCVLCYTATVENLSSQQIRRRLGLDDLGAELTIRRPRPHVTPAIGRDRAEP